MTKSEDNLKAAFAGESQANRKYLAFAKKAEQEGYPGVARLFRAAWWSPASRRTTQIPPKRTYMPGANRNIFCGPGTVPWYIPREPAAHSWWNGCSALPPSSRYTAHS